MKYITLLCNAGMSTSLMVNKMRRIATKQNIEVEIHAMAEFAFQKYDKPTDVLLLGPQVRYKYDVLKDSLNRPEPNCGNRLSGLCIDGCRGSVKNSIKYDKRKIIRGGQNNGKIYLCNHR